MTTGKPEQDDSIVVMVLDAMADKALEGAGPTVILAVERFSAGVDRLMNWLPADHRPLVLELARAHGYCTPAQIERMRTELH